MPKKILPVTTYTSIDIISEFSIIRRGGVEGEGVRVLHRTGMNSSVFDWIWAFLSNRSQLVVLDGEGSDSCHPIQLPCSVWCSPGRALLNLGPYLFCYLYTRHHTQQHQAVNRRHNHHRTLPSRTNLTLKPFQPGPNCSKHR